MSFIPLTSTLNIIRANPSILRQNIPAMVAKLQSQAKSDSQGTGNKVTAQEASFANIMESNGIRFQPKDTKLPTAPGYYYLYQANGSQQSIDFRVFEFDGKAVVRKVDLDLKHTSKDVFYLNDGWFIHDVIYVVTWNRRTSQPRKRITSEPATFIALGQNIPSAAEHAMIAELLAVKKKYNADFKCVDSLCPYIRFANRYKCDRFTPEFTELCYADVDKYIQSVSSSSASPASSASLSASPETLSTT
jgi:hypothetical protein